LSAFTQQWQSGVCTAVLRLCDATAKHAKIYSKRECVVLRIVVVSDTHGKISKFEDVILQQPKADYFIHLGDGEGDVDEVRFEFPALKFLNVSGNCDFASVLPNENELVVCGKRIFYTHGNRYFVKSGIWSIVDEAMKRRADIALFGHTHQAMTSYERGIYIMNPGSLGYPEEGRPTYGIVDITGAGIVTNVVEV